MQLLLQSTWQTSDPDQLLQVQEWMFGLIDIFNDGECSTGPAYACFFDFATDNVTWEVVSDFGLGTWVSGHGYQTTLNSGAGLYQAIIANVEDNLGTITSIDLNYDGGPGPVGSSGVNMYWSDTFGTLHLFKHDVAAAGPNTLAWTGILDSYSKIVLELNNGGQSAAAYITGVTVNGHSTDAPC